MRIERREFFILPLAGHVEYLGIGIFLENVLNLAFFVFDYNHDICVLNEDEINKRL